MGGKAGRSYGHQMTNTTSPTMSSTRLDDVADRFIAAVESGDIANVVACYAPDGRQVHPFSPEPVVGRDAIRASDGALMAAFPDVRIERRNVAGVGMTVVIELVLVGTNTGDLDLGDEVISATGRTIRVPSVWVIDLDESGLISEERAYFDSAVFFRQLGLQG